MPRRRIRVDPTSAVRDGLTAIRAEFAVPSAFPPAALAEARMTGVRHHSFTDLRDVPFFTIDPPGARDLDQAMALERDGGGYRVRYAIADVPAFVRPGGAIDAEARARGVTIYLPGERAPLHPPELSEDAASLLPGVDRLAVVWDLRLDGDGELVDVAVDRATVRSHEQLDYATAQDRGVPLLQEIGERRMAIAAARGASRLALPEQEVVCGPDGWTVAYRAPLAIEEWNAEISLLTGMAAARIMCERGAGVLRAQPPPTEEALAGLARKARAVNAWCLTPVMQGYAAWVSALDPADPCEAALLHEAAVAGEPARYVAFAGDPPSDAGHFAIAAPYAHVTAPLRRLVDRFALALCLPEPEPWALETLEEVPALMDAATRRAGAVERAVVDLVEAVLLADRVGQEFTGVVLEADEKGGRVLLRDPAVRARAAGAGLRAGAEARLRLIEADPQRRAVRFEVA